MIKILLGRPRSGKSREIEFKRAFYDRADTVILSYGKDGYSKFKKAVVKTYIGEPAQIATLDSIGDATMVIVDESQMFDLLPLIKKAHDNPDFTLIILAQSMNQLRKSLVAITGIEFSEDAAMAIDLFTRKKRYTFELTPNNIVDSKILSVGPRYAAGDLRVSNKVSIRKDLEKYLDGFAIPS